MKLFTTTGKKKQFSLDLWLGWASLIAQLVKNPPAVQETLVQIPGSGRSPGEGKGYQL